MRLVNQARNAYESATGQPAPTNFNAVKGIVADEVNKAALGSGGALADREDLKQQLSAANSPQ